MPVFYFFCTSCRNGELVLLLRKNNQNKYKYMKKVFILTHSQAHFEFLHTFLLENGYENNQTWEDVETSLKVLTQECLRVSWPDIKKEPYKDPCRPNGMSFTTVGRIKKILLGESDDADELPNLYFIDRDLVYAHGESIFGCIKYALAYKFGDMTNQPVVYFCHDYMEEVPFRLFTKYVSLDVNPIILKRELIKTIQELGEQPKRKIISHLLRNNFKH